MQHKTKRLSVADIKIGGKTLPDTSDPDGFVTIECKGIKIEGFIKDDGSPFDDINKVIRAKNEQDKQLSGSFNISGSFKIE